MADVVVTLPEDRDVIVLDNGQPTQIATVLIDAAVALGLDPRVIRVQPFVGGFVAPASVVSTIDVTPEPPVDQVTLDTRPPGATTHQKYGYTTFVVAPVGYPESMTLDMSVNGGPYVPSGASGALEYGETNTHVFEYGPDDGTIVEGDVVTFRATDSGGEFTPVNEITLTWVFVAA